MATIGGLNDPAQMEEIGKADVVYMGRALLADPFLPNKVMANKDEDIVRCLRCFTCMAERAGTYAKMAKDAGVEIRLNTEVTKGYVEKEAPDALIIAVGSTPLIPPSLAWTAKT